MYQVSSEVPNGSEEQIYRKSRRRHRSLATSTPPAVHLHIGSDGPASNGSISSRGTDEHNDAEIIFSV